MGLKSGVVHTETRIYGIWYVIRRFIRCMLVMLNIFKQEKSVWGSHFIEVYLISTERHQAGELQVF